MKPHLSQAQTAGTLVFTSGQLALDEAGQLRGDSVGDQTLLALRNLERVLATEGLGLRDVVKTTVWITRPADFADFNRVYGEVFGDHRPARSTVVAQLALAAALVEIEAVADRRAV